MCSPRCRYRRCASTRSTSTRPTPRFYGAVALALVLFFYAANSEVVWLYLLAYWIAALVVVSFVYAAWNKGFSLDATLALSFRSQCCGNPGLVCRLLPGCVGLVPKS